MIAQLYRLYADDDGSYRSWTNWQETDRLTGRTLWQNGQPLIEVEHTHRVRGIFWRPTRFVTTLELYGPDQIRYEENMGTKLDPGEFDCYAKALADEPMFTLLARDPLAPILVRLWAELTVGRNKPEKNAEARQVAAAMETWRKENPA